MSKKWKMIVILLVPWLSIVKFGKWSFLRFLPTIIFSDLIIALISELSREYNWWKVRNPLFPRLATDVSFVFGPFTILNFWIFKLTYPKLGLYVLSNLVADYLFAYPLTTLAEKFRIYKMGTMSRLQLFLLSVSVAIGNYAFHYFLVEPARKGRGYSRMRASSKM